MSELARITIIGHPAILKNDKEIAYNTKTKRQFITMSTRAKKYVKRATSQIWKQWRRKAPITCNVSASMIFYGAWRGESENSPDLSNLYQMPEDLLQKCGVIANDRQIKNHDGSEIVYMCDWACSNRPVITRGKNKGRRKEHCGMQRECPYERIIITLYECDEVVMDDVGHKTIFGE